MNEIKEGEETQKVIHLTELLDYKSYWAYNFKSSIYHILVCGSCLFLDYYSPSK